MATYQESKLLREIAKCERELVALKSPQRYLMGQVKGFVSNQVRVDSRVLAQRSGYEYRGILGWFKFLGDKPLKQVNSKIKFQLYNSSGSPINVSLSQGSGVTVEALESSRGDNPNEMWFIAYFDTSGAQGSVDAFYGQFWCVSNDSGILVYEGDIQGPDYG